MLIIKGLKTIFIEVFSKKNGFKMLFHQQSWYWHQRNSNPQRLSSNTNTQPLSQIGQMIELCWEYLPVRCFWLYVTLIPYTRFRVNLHSMIWMPRNSLLDDSDSNWIWTKNHLVRKQTLNHSAKLANRLSYVVSTYLYGAFEYMLLSFHVRF